MLKNADWKTLSIVKNQSENFNKDMVSKIEIQENSSPVCFANTKEVRDDYKTE